MSSQDFIHVFIRLSMQQHNILTCPILGGPIHIAFYTDSTPGTPYILCKYKWCIWNCASGWPGLHAYPVPGTVVGVGEYRFRDKSKNRNQPTSQGWRLEEHRKAKEQGLHTQGPRANAAGPQGPGRQPWSVPTHSGPPV